MSEGTVFNASPALEVILLRERVKQLEDEIQQLTSVSFEDGCEEWKTTLAEARAEGYKQGVLDAVNPEANLDLQTFDLNTSEGMKALLAAIREAGDG